jgi:hypothetical protein
MDISAFYGIVAGINFTLLGLWWVAVQERADLRRPESGTGQMAYVVSLLWRAPFVLGGAAGIAGIGLLVPVLLRTHLRTAAGLLLGVGLPLHALVVIVALLPDLASTTNSEVSNLQVEGILFALLVLLGAHTAWTAAMSPRADEVAGHR